MRGAGKLARHTATLSLKPPGQGLTDTTIQSRLVNTGLQAATDPPAEVICIRTLADSGGGPGGGRDWASPAAVPSTLIAAGASTPLGSASSFSNHPISSARKPPWTFTDQTGSPKVRSWTKPARQIGACYSTEVRGWAHGEMGDQLKGTTG